MMTSKEFRRIRDAADKAMTDSLRQARADELSGLDALDIMAKRACEYQTGLKFAGIAEHGRIVWRSAIHNALLGLGDAKPEFKPFVEQIIGEIPRWHVEEGPCR